MRVKSVLAAAVVCLYFTVLQAEIQDSAGIIFPSIELSAGARASAMGEAYTAIAEGSSGPIFNPAGLGFLQKTEVSTAFNKWFVDSFYQHFMAAVPLETGAVGIDIFYINFGIFERLTTLGYAESGTPMNPFTFQGLISYGMQFGNRFSAGIGLKYFGQSLDQTMQSGIAGNLGLLYRAGGVSAGLAVSNLGSAGAYALPLSIKAGGSFEFMKTQQHFFIGTVDVNYILNGMPGINAGIEYTYAGIVSARAGYRLYLGEDNLTGLKGLSAGAGIQLGQFGLDYAFTPYGELGMAHMVSLKYIFEKSEEEKEKLKPRGSEAVKKGQATKADLYLMLGEAGTMENEGDLKAAELKYREIIGIDKNYADAWKRLGAVYYKEDRKGDAIRAFEAYLKIRPDDEAVANWLKKHGNEK